MSEEAREGKRWGTFERKMRIAGDLVFETAFHIGSGKEGELATDMGVMKEVDGRPLLPGSTLKGCFRSAAERLAFHLDLRACLLDASLSGVPCVGDEAYRRKVLKEFQALPEEKEKLQWLEGHTCHVCRLFGSPFQASRIFFGDGELKEWAGSYQVRDGVCIDRDSETARPKLKYDFETAPAGARFGFRAELENPVEEDLALTGAVLAEWESGLRLGGFTSRGLGCARLENVRTEQVDCTDFEQLRAYLVERRMSPVESSVFTDALDRLLSRKGG